MKLSSPHLVDEDWLWHGCQRLKKVMDPNETKFNGDDEDSRSTLTDFDSDEDDDMSDSDKIGSYDKDTDEQDYADGYEPMEEQTEIFQKMNSPHDDEDDEDFLEAQDREEEKDAVAATTTSPTSFLYFNMPRPSYFGGSFLALLQRLEHALQARLPTFFLSFWQIELPEPLLFDSLIRPI